MLFELRAVLVVTLVSLGVGGCGEEPDSEGFQEILPALKTRLASWSSAGDSGETVEIWGQRRGGGLVAVHVGPDVRRVRFHDASSRAWLIGDGDKLAFYDAGARCIRHCAFDLSVELGEVEGAVTFSVSVRPRPEGTEPGPSDANVSIDLVGILDCLSNRARLEAPEEYQALAMEGRTPSKTTVSIASSFLFETSRIAQVMLMDHDSPDLESPLLNLTLHRPPRYEKPLDFAVPPAEALPDSLRPKSDHPLERDALEARLQRALEIQARLLRGDSDLGAIATASAEDLRGFFSAALAEQLRRKQR